MKTKNLWAVIPAHNEEKNIRKTVEKTLDYVDKVAVVDGERADNSAKLAERAGAVVLRHMVNLGKGAALKTGCDYAFSRGATHVVALDADAQHNPDDIPRFSEKLGNYDLIFSYRKSSRQMPAVLRFGNWIISEIASLLYNVDLKDTQSGFRAFSRETYKKIRWSASDYSMESEMISRAGKQKLKYTQIPIETIYSDKYKGTTVIDGVKIVLNMLWWKLFNGNK